MHATLIENLIEKFEGLPGIGRRSAERIAFHILERMSEEEASSMASCITEAKSKIQLCPVCQNLTDTAPCRICSSPKRDASVVCVVESPEDVSAIEATNEYHGLYHVLHGALSPMDGITPDDIKIKTIEYAVYLRTADTGHSICCDSCGRYGKGSHYGDQPNRQRHGYGGVYFKAAVAFRCEGDAYCARHPNRFRS